MKKTHATQAEIDAAREAVRTCGLSTTRLSVLAGKHPTFVSCTFSQSRRGRRLLKKTIDGILAVVERARAGEDPGPVPTHRSAPGSIKKRGRPNKPVKMPVCATVAENIVTPVVKKGKASMAADGMLPISLLGDGRALVRLFVPPCITSTYHIQYGEIMCEISPMRG